MNLIKNRTIVSMCLAVVLTLVGLSGITSAQEPEKDEIIFTTYYPAPYGVYNEFKANKVVVGEELDTEDLKDGELQVGSHIILNPADEPDAVRGGLYYDDDDDEIKYSDGSAWEPMGGAGGGFTGKTSWLSNVSFNCHDCTAKKDTSTNDEWTYGPFTKDAFVMINTRIDITCVTVCSGNVLVEVDGNEVARSYRGSDQYGASGTPYATWTIPVQAGENMRIVASGGTPWGNVTATIKSADIYYLE